jgi:RNA polymerase sigma-70 factor (ECF subfamily)
VRPSEDELEGARDAELMVAFAAGETRAFELLFARHRRRLFTFLVHQTGDRAAAEDLFQDIFLRLIQARESFQPERPFRAWLFTIARNALVDRHRRLGVRSIVRPEGDMQDSFPMRASTESGPRKAAELAELKTYIESALDALPAEQREVFLLRERARLDYVRIAELTGADISTLKSRMRYALAGLRQALEGTPCEVETSQ